MIWDRIDNDDDNDYEGGNVFFHFFSIFKKKKIALFTEHGRENISNNTPTLQDEVFISFDICHITIAVVASPPNDVMPESKLPVRQDHKSM